MDPSTSGRRNATLDELARLYTPHTEHAESRASKQSMTYDPMTKKHKCTSDMMMTVVMQRNMQQQTLLVMVSNKQW